MNQRAMTQTHTPCDLHPPETRRELANVREAFASDNLESAIVKMITNWALTLSPNACRLMDMGCGNQPYRALLEKKGFEYHSLDMWQNGRGTVEYVTPLDGDLPPTLLQGAKFDYVFCTEVAEHIPNWTSLFNNVSSLLNKGGKALITCPFFFPIHSDPYDFWRPTPFALEHWAKKHGFKIVHQEKLGALDDVLGLLLGHLIMSMQYKSPTSFFERVTLFVHQRLVRLTIKTMHWLVCAGFFKRNFSSVQDIYISNVIVLEKN